MTFSREYLSCWGKTGNNVDGVLSWHPIACHQLDVAAVAGAILDSRPRVLARAARLLGLEEAPCRSLIVALTVLHDLGKFAPAFLGKVPELWPTYLLGPCDPVSAGRTHHTDDGYQLWQMELADVIGERLWVGGADALDMLAIAVFGHHGRPIKPNEVTRRPSAWGRARPLALHCAKDLIELVHPEPTSAPCPSREQTGIASWWFAGLLTLADWIGSRERWFKFVGGDPSLDLNTYWQENQCRAAEAIRAEGLASPPLGGQQSFLGLTGKSTPSPAQAWALSVDLPPEPTLIIIEDVTGAGKTEAAQVLVHRLMMQGGSSGAYWAMPTQATANAMYERQANCLDKLFGGFAPDAARPSLVLSHGQSRLHERFRDTVISASDRDVASDRLRNDDVTPSSVLCAEFFADDRRAALLADVGVGTIDQALLGVLPSKFNTMRLFGLADKVLVVDEAHAYDAYMSTELEELLVFHAALGGSAVVLTATLPLKKREDLVQAWVRGLAGGRRSIPRPGAPARTEALTRHTNYPLATLVTRRALGAEVTEVPLAATKWSQRSVPVRFVHDCDSALAVVQAGRDAGGAVLWIRNTVKDCLEATAQLRARGVDVLVFHARFAQVDRQRREAEVLAIFGKASTPDVRRGRVLVSTQVVEQSLDLDFDVMVSDIAPIDLLVQRAGRLWRHDRERPPGIVREMVVLSPPFEENPTKDWMRGQFAGTNAVYGNVGVLWRTARTLTGSSPEIVTPEGLREVIESVYGSEDVPEGLQKEASKAEGGERADRAVGQMAVLDLRTGYHGDEKGWVDDQRAITRLGREETTIRLARLAPDGAVVPWAHDVDGPPWKQWALSEVRVPAWRVPVGSEDAGHAQAVASLRKLWHRFEETIPVVVLTEAEDSWAGTLVHPSTGKPIAILYGADRGGALVDAK
jgi:CRISPR-associated endonuclease/helicase Cas3